jgi:hypothetical protein
MGAKDLQQLFRVGRTSLLIGLLCLRISIAIGNLAARTLGESTLGSVLRESLLIGGWVAMWRPLEIFLYDGWPIRDEARHDDRLSRDAGPDRLRGESGREKWHRLASGHPGRFSQLPHQRGVKHNEPGRRVTLPTGRTFLPR